MSFRSGRAGQTALTTSVVHALLVTDVRAPLKGLRHVQIEGKKSGNPAFSLNTSESKWDEYGKRYISLEELRLALLTYQRQFRGTSNTYKPETVLDPVIAVLEQLA